MEDGGQVSFIVEEKQQSLGFGITKTNVVFENFGT